jgi:hypothetical protein
MATVVVRIVDDADVALLGSESEENHLHISYEKDCLFAAD